MNVIRNQGSLITYALGSCVGVCLYERRLKLAGMIHIMLPSMANMGYSDKALKYADAGIPLLISKMEQQGAERCFMTAKIAGGASMFAFSTVSLSSMDNIGERNTSAVIDALKKSRIPLKAQDTGGTCARTMEISGATGEVLVRSYGRPDYYL